MNIGVKSRKSFHINEDNVINRLAEDLYLCLNEAGKDSAEIYIVCIGSDRATGDSLGPIIGHMISSQLQNPNVKVYGNLDRPVHAANIERAVDRIYLENDEPLIIAVDAALSRSADSIGLLNIGIGSLNPGAFAEKYLLPIGHIYITGVVNWADRLGEIDVLQSTRLGFVMKMADIMSQGICLALNKWKENTEIY